MERGVSQAAVNDFSKSALSEPQHMALLGTLNSIKTETCRGLTIATATVWLPAYVNGQSMYYEH